MVLFGDKRVSKVLSYIDDIKPYRFVQLIAGVGSGKNYFINSLIKGHPDERHDGSITQLEPLTVLLITSRRSKVDELLTEEDVPADGKVCRWDSFHSSGNPDIDWEHIKATAKQITFDNDWGTTTIYQRSVFCTNAFIERYLQYRYNPLDQTTHLWDLFDLIVVDEAHALIVDASFQNSPFYTWDFVCEFLRRHQQAEKDPNHYDPPRCNNLILMTGSDQPLKKLKFPEKPHIINLMDECINVVPKQIHFIASEDVKRNLAAQISQGDKVLYFANHISYPKEFCEGTSIDPQHVAISFSSEKRRKTFKKNDEQAFKMMEYVDHEVTRNHNIPEGINMWLTTSRNQEGINIENSDFNRLYVENHVQSNVIQMAGRIRCGVKHMYIVVDAPGHFNSESEFEPVFSKHEIASNSGFYDTTDGAANDYLEKLCAEHNISGLFNQGRDSYRTAYQSNCKPIGDYISFIHDKFPYIRYSYFRNVFLYYAQRQAGLKYQDKCRKTFENALEDPVKLQALLKQWFPKSEVELYQSPEKLTREQQNAEAIKYMESIGAYDSTKHFNFEEFNSIRDKLNEIYGKQLSQLNTLLGYGTNLRYQPSTNKTVPDEKKKYRFYLRDQMADAS